MPRNFDFSYGGWVCIWILRAGVGTGYWNCHFMPLHQIPHLHCISHILTKKLAKFERLKHRRNVQLTFKLFHGLPNDSPGLLWVCQVHHHGGNLDIGCLLLASPCSLLQGSLKERVGKKLVLKMSQKFIKKQWYISCQNTIVWAWWKFLNYVLEKFRNFLKFTPGWYPQGTAFHIQSRQSEEQLQLLCSGAGDQSDFVPHGNNSSLSSDCGFESASRRSKSNVHRNETCLSREASDFFSLHCTPVLLSTHF